MKYAADLEADIGFGKYTDKTYSDVLDDDPKYIVWLIEEGIVEFTDEDLAEIALYV